MWRVKRLADPDGVPRPGRRAEPRPRRPPAQPEDDAADRGVGDGLRRVRLLRAGLPEPQPDDDAAPADRAAARDGPPARRARRCARRCSRSSSTTRSRPAPPTAPASSPARSGSTPATLVKELRAERHTERAEQLALRRRASAGGRSRARPRAGRSRLGGPLRAADQARRAVAARAPPRVRRAARRTAATDGRRRAVYVPSCTNRIFGVELDGARPAEALVEVSARAGMPVWIPDDVGGTCCGLPWSSKGFERGAPQKANEMVERLWALERRGGAAGRDRRRLLHPGHRRPRRRRARARRTPSASPSSRSSTRSPGPTTACCPGSRSAEKVGSATVHPTCATRHLGLGRPAASPRRSPRRGRLRRPHGDLLRLRRRPRHLPPRADRRRDRAPRPPSSPAATSTPTSPATAPARSASSAPPASPTSRSSSCSSASPAPRAFPPSGSPPHSAAASSATIAAPGRSRMALRLGQGVRLHLAGGDHRQG